MESCITDRNVVLPEAVASDLFANIQKTFPSD